MLRVLRHSMVMRHPASQSGTSPCLLVFVEFNIYVLLHHLLYPCNVAPLLLGICRGPERALFIGTTNWLILG